MWNPDVYEQFADLRARPFHELVALVEPPGAAPSIVDLGCGPGGLTASLTSTFPGADVLGVDNSPEMLERAASHADDRVRFAAGDIASFERPDRYDVVVSNSALHWVDDHRLTLARWAASLRAGGQLAVSLPANFGHPSHTVAEALGHDPTFADAWTTGRPPANRGDFLLEPGEYASLLFDLGFEQQSVSLRVYPQVMASSAQVVDWVRGTLLVPYRAALPPDAYAEFERRYADDLAAAIGGPAGERRPYFYGFERILMWGRLGPDRRAR